MPAVAEGRADGADHIRCKPKCADGEIWSSKFVASPNGEAGTLARSVNRIDRQLILT